VFRFKSPVTAKERYMGLAPASDVTLAEARDAAQAARQLIRDGKDPIEHRNEQKAAARVEAAKAISFQDFAEQFIATDKPGWRNAKHAQQWGEHAEDIRLPCDRHHPCPQHHN
jgi:Arm DNA-binding domain